jgi:hypothetical protein
MTCVLVLVFFISRFRRPTADGVLLPKILLRNGIDVRYVIGPKSVLVVDLKFGLGVCLDIRSVCLTRNIFGSAAPLPDLHRVVGELYLLLLFFASPVCIYLFK